MADEFKLGKDRIEAKIHLNRSSISRAMSNILIMYLQDKYNIMSEKEIMDYFYEYKIYDKFDRIIKKCDSFTKEIADKKD